MKEQYPQLKDFPQNTFAGGGIETKKLSDIWAVAFITYGSGVPVIGSQCFMVENNDLKLQKIINPP